MKIQWWILISLTLMAWGYHNNDTNGILIAGFLGIFDSIAGLKTNSQKETDV